MRWQSRSNTKKDKTRLIADLLQQSYDLIADLTKRMDMADLNTAKRSGILTGLCFSDKKHERNLQIQELFYEELNVTVEIEDTYCLGERELPPVVIVFESVSMKRRVFENKAKLNQLSGYKGRKIYLNNYLPTSVNEQKKRERQIVKDHKNGGNPAITMEITKKGLKIGNEMYKKKVRAPQPGDLLNTTPDELDAILETKTVKGPQLKVKDNIFGPLCH